MWHLAKMGEMREAYRMLDGKPLGKHPLGRQRRRWENIKMDLKELELVDGRCMYVCISGLCPMASYDMSSIELFIPLQ
jgi:hypothetical protein